MAPEEANTDDPTENLDEEVWDTVWEDASDAFQEMEASMNMVMNVLDADDMFEAGELLEEHATDEEVEAFRSITNVHSELEGSTLPYLESAVGGDEE